MEENEITRAIRFGAKAGAQRAFASAYPNAGDGLRKAAALNSAKAAALLAKVKAEPVRRYRGPRPGQG